MTTPPIVPQLGKPSLRDNVLAGFVAGLVGVGLVGLLRFTPVHLPCGMLILTGWQCPFCGGTRMADSLLHFDVVGAWHHNSALLIVGALFVARWLGWCVELLLLKRTIPAYWTPAAVRRLWWVWALVGGIAWVLIRNLALS
jgi:hypothetical protein